MRLARLTRATIAVVALHSLVLGAALLADPHRALTIAGWPYHGDRFFPAQSGIFLVILGVGYLVAMERRAFAWGLVVSKALAVTFLTMEWRLGGAPPVAGWAAGLDALMGLAVAALLLAERRRPLVR